MFKIGEFSQMVKVSPRMLRYYEKCGLLSPAETDPFTGYRLYSAAQLPILFKIVQLRDMGFGVDEILEILPNFHDMDKMQAILQRKTQEIYVTIHNEQNKLAKIAAMNDIVKLNKEGINMVFDVELKELKAQQILSLREIVSTAENEPKLWEKLYDFIAANDITCDAGGYSIYHDEEYKENDVDIEIAVPVSKLGANQDEFVYKELPAIPQAATIHFSGPYEGYNPAMEKLAGWMEQNNYEFAGLIRGFAVVSQADAASPADYLTELQVPVQKV